MAVKNPIKKYLREEPFFMLIQKITNVSRKHPKILLSVFILLTACVVYHQYIFGGSFFLFRDIGSDTAEQYIMHYSSVVSHIRSGNFSLWDFSNGFGASVYHMILFNPALWLLYLPGILFGPQVMPGCLIYIYMLILVLSGLAVWSFLSCFSFSAKSRFIASYVYAFSGFLTAWGQHYHFGIIMILFPLLLMFLEKSLRSERFSLGTVLCTGVMVLSTYYFSYMALIAAACYLLLRILVLQRQGLKAFCRTFFRQCLSLLLGVGIGALNLLPSYALIYNVSARMDSGMGLLQRCLSSLAPWPADYYNTLLHRMFSGNLQGIGSSEALYTGYANYYEAPALFFSSLFILLLIQFFFVFPGMKTGRRAKAAGWTAVAGGAFSLLIMLGSLVFNGFSYPFSRHTFLLMPFFALLTAYMLNAVLKEKRFSPAGAVLAAVFCVAVYLPSARQAATRTFRCNALLLCATALGMAALLFLLARSRKKRVRSLSFTLLFLAVILNVASDAYTSVSGRDTVQWNSSYLEDLYGEDFQALTAYLREADPTFYRMEKDYAAGSQCMDSMGQGYRGISTYNSTENRYILEFADKLLPNLYYVNNAHLSFRQIANDTGYASLFGIKYLVSKNPDLQNPGYKLIRQFGTLFLYENQECGSFAKFYTKTLSAADYESAADTLDTESLLSELLITEDENEFTVSAGELERFACTPTDAVSIDTGALPETVSADGSGALSWSVPSVSIPLRGAGSASGQKITVTFDLSVNGSFDVEIRTDEGEAPYTATVVGGTPVSVTLSLPENAEALIFTTHSPTLTTTVSNIRFYCSEEVRHSSDAEIAVEDTGNDSSLICSASVSEDGLLFLPVPYEEGWQASVDGQETELIRADYGFTAVRLSAGEHTVTLTYQQPLFTEALIISVSCCGICIIPALFRRRKNLKNSSHE